MHAYKYHTVAAESEDIVCQQLYTNEEERAEKEQVKQTTTCSS